MTPTPSPLLSTHGTRTQEYSSTHSTRTRAYPRIPLCPPQTEDETQPEYATRVLRHVLTHGTCTLTDRQLDDADQGAQWYATHARNQDGLASRLERHQLRLIEQFSAARHEIASARRIRAELDRQAAPAPLGATNAPVGGSQPGRPAALLPGPPRGPGMPDALPLPRPQAPVADGIRF